MKNLQKFFQGLTLTTFGLGIYNTVKNSNNKELLNNFFSEQEKNKNLLKEIDKLKTRHNELEISTLESNNEVLRKSLEVITSKNDIDKDLNKLKSLTDDIKDNNSYSSEEVQNNLNNILEKLTKDITDNSNKTNQLIKIIEDILGSDSNNFINTNQILESIQNLYSKLSFIDSLVLTHLSGSIFILISLYYIILILFGDKLISYFKLEEKYPKIAKYIQLRRKLQNYSITFNFILIILVLLIIILFDLYILLLI